MRRIPILFALLLVFASCEKEIFIVEEVPPTALQCEDFFSSEIPEELQCTLDMCYGNATFREGRRCSKDSQIVHYTITLEHKDCVRILLFDRDGKIVSENLYDCG